MRSGPSIVGIGDEIGLSTTWGMFPLNVASPKSDPARQLLEYLGALAIEIVPPTYVDVAG